MEVLTQERVAVLKTVGCKSPVGSNPIASAKKSTQYCRSETPDESPTQSRSDLGNMLAKAEI